MLLISRKKSINPSPLSETRYHISVVYALHRCKNLCQNKNLERTQNCRKLWLSADPPDANIPAFNLLLFPFSLQFLQTLASIRDSFSVRLFPFVPHICLRWFRNLNSERLYHKIHFPSSFSSNYYFSFTFSNKTQDQRRRNKLLLISPSLNPLVEEI